MAKKKFDIFNTVETVKAPSINQVPAGNRLIDAVKENIKILPELEYFIRKLNSPEYHLLLTDIQKNGCKEPIKLWRRENDFVIVDGHHRFQICQELGIDFKTESIEFNSIEDVKSYMAKVQLGRRNLTAQENAYLRGMQYDFAKKGVGQYNKKEGNTRDLLAEEYGVSSATISRDFWTYQAVEKLPVEHKQLFLEGDSFLQKQDLEFIAKNELDIETFLNYREQGNSLQNFQKKDEKQGEIQKEKQKEKKHYFSSFSSRFIKDFQKANSSEKQVYKQQLLELIKSLDEV